MILFKLSQDAIPYGPAKIEQVKTAAGMFNVSKIVVDSLPRLAKDFVCVEDRAREAANDIFNNTKLWQIGVPLISAFIMAALSLFGKPWETDIIKANSKIESIEKKLDYDKQIAELKTKIDKLITEKSSPKP